MKSNAAGQLLGYTLQFPRALYYLLQCGPEEVVCIEVMGDVAAILKNDQVITEEDKSSITSKPITDKSTDLWKTLSNWIEAIKDKSLDITKTKFLLYCNKKGRKSIVDQFSDASNETEAIKAIKYAENKLKDIDKEHEIFKFYNNVIEHKNLLKRIIERFEVLYGDVAGYEEVDLEIKKKHVPETQIDFIRDKLSGWLLKFVQEKIYEGKKGACITWEEFDKQFKVLFERVRQRELVDFTLEQLPGSSEIQKEVKVRPKYLRQLDHIGCSEGEIVEAVSDYLRANVNRQKWIENEIIDEEVAIDFINKLKDFWNTQTVKIKITQKHLDDEEQGQLIFAECRSRQENIRGVFPPYPTISGTYHALANEPVIGWHPAWKTKFVDDGGE